MIGIWHRWRQLTTAPAFSSKGLMLWAVGSVLMFLILHLCGLRQYTAILSGTVVGRGQVISGFLGLFYMFMYFGALLMAPPALFAAAVTAAFEAWWRRRRA